MSTTFVVTPAYDHRYSTEEAVREAWLKGVDFRIHGTSTYFSIRNRQYLLDQGFEHVVIVYHNGTRPSVWAFTL